MPAFGSRERGGFPPLPSFLRKEGTLPELEIYDRILKAYRSWNTHENGEVIDFDLTAGADYYEEVARGFGHQPMTKDRFHMETILSSLLDRLASTEPSSREYKHVTEFLTARLQASQWFLRRLIGADNFDNYAYLEKTAGLILDEIDNDFLISWRNRVFKLAQSQEIPINSPDAYKNWATQKRLKPQKVDELAREAVQKSLRATERFTGEPADLEYSVETVKKDKYYWAWSKTDPVTLLFVLALNLHSTKIWTPGKAEELGGHEGGEHLRRMNDWRKQIRREKMPDVVGQTIVHGPESLVEEGLALTIAHYIPEIYEGLSDEGKFQVDASILRHMVYANVSLRLNSPIRPKAQEIIDYIHEFLPWESSREIRRQIKWRTKDPTYQAYLPSYGFGAKLFLDIIDILNTRGRKQLLRELSEKPFTPVQLKKRAIELSTERRNKSTTLLTNPLMSSA